MASSTSSTSPTPPPPPHPSDGFNTLRFCVGVYIPNDEDDDSNDGDRPDDSSDFATQTVELCFHDTFIPRPDQPLSLHLSGAGSDLTVIRYHPPPTLSIPTPPCFIVECHGLVRLVPPTSAAASSSASPLAFLSPAPLSIPSRPSWCRPPFLFSAVVAVLSIVLFVFRAPCHPRSSSETCGITNSSHFDATNAIHDATHLTLPTDLLEIADAWARIPLRLATLDRLDSSDNDPDAALLAGLSRDAALRDTREVARTVFRAIISPPSTRDASSAPTGNHHTDAARFRHSSLTDSVAAAVASWREVADEIKVAWSRPLTRDASELRRLLHTIPIVDDADALFFHTEGGGNIASLDRRLLPVVDGKLRLAVSPAAGRVLDVYLDSFAESISQSRECAFFRACTHPPPPPDRLHPVCQMPPLPLDHSIVFLEGWDQSRRQSLANRTQTTAVDHDLLDEPPLVALARHLTALGSRVDDLITMATSLGANKTKIYNKRGMGDWARGYFQRPRLPEDNESASNSNTSAAIAAERLRGLRISSIHPQETSAVMAVVAARDACTRLEELRDTAFRLRGGEGWVRIAMHTDTRVTHAQLPRPKVLAEAADALAARVEADGHQLTEGLYRLMAAQRSDWWRVGGAEDADSNG
ncbi:hypothetical protein CkaCkLH20_12255 [Colletotrichum karsti]|uniref:Uncharacterized protein n=1 Tax=Colletotrichum karsti TaxID=1095194 RepID=A0A9P6HXU3_9PEZI|nr:uncharacterized protein CkaCkLH20_12255 [Colletotrichum karsti]KAF9870291.1 hypothetical protein CkaCkLH20_12255 [Colletotrichum karsti]